MTTPGAYRAPGHTLTPPEGDQTFTRTEIHGQKDGGRKQHVAAFIREGRIIFLLTKHPQVLLRGFLTCFLRLTTHPQVFDCAQTVPNVTQN